MHRLILTLLGLTIVPGVSHTIIPTTPGMTWRYDMTQEAGEGFRFAGPRTDVQGRIRVPVTYRLDGPLKVNGKDVLKFEMHRSGVVTNSDLMTVDDRGILCSGRINLDGETVPLDPPQIIVAAPIKTGNEWDFDGKIGPYTVHQHYAIIDHEDVKVPAGKFHAFHIHGEQTVPNNMSVDRWFTPGVGIIKDVTTMKSSKGDLLHRITLDLNEKPKVGPRPEVKPLDPPKKLSVTVGLDPIGNSILNFNGNTPKIFARWQGHGLRRNAKIRAVWIAEDIGDIAPHDYPIDDATTTASDPNSRGVFTLSRPDDGWAPGTYRVEFFVDDIPSDSAKLIIGR